jgi:CRISPR-associated protein Cst2
MKPAYSISLMARVIYNLHALNNETSEGNRTLIRNVGLVVPSPDDQAPEFVHVNAISGSMFRHIFETHLRSLALDMKLGISSACVSGHPFRIWGDREFQKFLQQSPEISLIYDMLLSCTVSDICGLMGLTQDIQIKRHSLLHVGWISGLPEITKSQYHQFLRSQPLHILADEPQTLMPYSKGTASGIYAIGLQAEVPRIGYNDMTEQYPNNENISINRQGRMQAMLLALAYTLLQPLGASVTSQLPHVIGVEGMFIVSSLYTKAPLVSPQLADYRMRAEKQRELATRIAEPDSMVSYPFETGEELLETAFKIAEDFEAAMYTK